MVLLKQKKREKAVKELCLNVNNQVYRTCNEKLEVWTNYFTNMYSADTDCDESFDYNNYQEINKTIDVIKTCSAYETDAIVNEEFTVEEILNEIKKLKCGKKGGWEGITNEHLKYGSVNLSQCLANLFHAMYTNEYVPHCTKRGLIYTLYKGSKKYEDDRKNYRGITLLPVISKLFDKVVLNRVKGWIIRNNIDFPSNNQHAYQETLCSILASFDVQETIHFNSERHSKTYLALLDSSSAFDFVWHNGLFVKLYTMGIKGKLWRVLFQNYQNMSSNVVFNGMMSSDIQIKRSVRQGPGVSPASS